MNITNPDQCISEWESALILTGDDSHIPKEDRARVLHEIDMLYNEMYDLLRLTSDNSFEFI